LNVGGCSRKEVFYNLASITIVKTAEREDKSDLFVQARGMYRMKKEHLPFKTRDTMEYGK
jgi:hypothetical protein